ncbi:hypothetical protein BT93_K1430 [Corymbia citriodora subsp. variegata]|nr:hypothetical protein BT93_K1430 [Corymbia citriodora subsp. variegata]
MLHKLLKVHKFARPSRPEPPRPAPAAAVYDPGEEAPSSALKIVHAGGGVECYFMPVPAARIVERYPSFYVTRPEVFRHPWEAVVGPDETLALGEKYYLVPRHTVKKLRRRTRRPSRGDRSADFSASGSFHGGGGGGRVAAINRYGDGDSSGSFVRRGDASDGSDVSADYFKVSKRKSSTTKKHVSFLSRDRREAQERAADGDGGGGGEEARRGGGECKKGAAEEEKSIR